MACLSHETVVALLEGALSGREAAAVDEHMDGCDACRGLVAAVVRGSLGEGRRDAQDAGLDAAPAPSAAHASTLVSGEVLGGRYRIVRSLGRGAMGVVYEAEDLQLGVTVALKVLRAEAAAATDLIERLRQEIVLGRRITHPNVCRLYDLAAADGLHFITMELLTGETLADHLARGPVPAERVAAIVDPICAALEAAHAHGVVHRDLKPSNIMVGHDGKVTVMDFGLARDLSAEASEQGRLVGTPAYWSPEQGQGRRATERSDIYTLGVITCELAGGARPSWNSLAPLSGLPDGLRSVVARCLRSDPEERYATVHELRAALASALGEGSSPRLTRGRRAVQVSAAAAMLVLAIAAAWLLIFPSTSPQMAVEEPGSSAAASPPPDPRVDDRIPATPTVHDSERDAGAAGEMGSRSAGSSAAPTTAEPRGAGSASVGSRAGGTREPAARTAARRRPSPPQENPSSEEAAEDRFFFFE